MLKELWAKVSPSEKFVAYGAAAVVVGWILGQILGSSTIGGGSVGGYNIPGVTINYFGWRTAGLLDSRGPPRGDRRWRRPVPQGRAEHEHHLAAARRADPPRRRGRVAGLRLFSRLLIQITNGGNPPILMYVADVLVIGGGAAMAWFTYQEFVTSKAA